MQKKYNHKVIEKKWQEYWRRKKIFKVSEDSNPSTRPGGFSQGKQYILDMFPYPSGAGLHVGHPKGYIATDIVSRMRMMQGYNVLHPMGWDAFGLPAENYAIKNKVHPSVATAKNIKTFKKQLGLLGFTYDWSREINTTDPNYYKWTQWIFLQMFKRGLAYESNEPINWCPSCKTGLANEDLETHSTSSGQVAVCERCGSVVKQKPLRQWVLKITDYADRLLKDLDLLDKWPEPIKEMQRNWIGKSEGATVTFGVIPTKSAKGGRVEGFFYNASDFAQKRDSSAPLRSVWNDNHIEVFTTRPDTLFGATYVVVAPEHKLIEDLRFKIEDYDEVSEYITKSKNKSALERTDLAKEKTGVELKGIKAINPANDEELPIFVADYVLGNYGTGAIMAVPAHDERDFEFAKKYGLKIKNVVRPYPVSPIVSGWGKDFDTTKAIDELEEKISKGEEVYVSAGIAINSNFLNNLQTPEAKEKMIQWLEEKELGKRQVQYKLRDWVFSRQRYWGEPIPLVRCEKCGWQPVSEKDLPLELPKVKHYEPSGTGESPLANIDKWVNTKCPVCSGPAKRETNTMPQWAGSCWYYLAYVMQGISNFQFPISNYRKAFEYWNPVDLYVGGAEHATRHLIYTRFWHKFLYDIGAVKNTEPFTRLQNVGLILAEDGRKMSKRWGNVINPDDVVREYGADAMRLYEMFMGPFDQSCAWSTQGLVGMKRFLERTWSLANCIIPTETREAGRVEGSLSEVLKRDSPAIARNDNLTATLHQTIKKVTEDIEGLRFNTAISQLMVLVNEMTKSENLELKTYNLLLQLLSPFAPHITEELWSQLGNKKSITQSEWPKYDPELAKEDKITIAVQINGKLRDTFEVPAEIDEEEVKKRALESEKIQKWLEGKEPKKVIYVKGKLVSIVV